MPVDTVVRWCEISNKTVIDWYNFCRDVQSSCPRMESSLVAPDMW